MGNVLQWLKQAWWLPVVLVVVSLLVGAKVFHMSFTDYVATRVIERLNADYSPFGPAVPNDAK